MYKLIHDLAGGFTGIMSRVYLSVLRFIYLFVWVFNLWIFSMRRGGGCSSARLYLVRVGPLATS